MYSASILTTLGFDVREEAFRYSAFPGRYATPIAGALLGATIVASSLFALRGNVSMSAALLAIGIAATAVFARWMLADGVLSAPWLRSEGVNLAATRGDQQPRVWLVAHLDSKSQPVPSAVRMAGVMVLAAALVVACVAVLLTLVGGHVRTPWWVALVAGVSGALPVMASVVGSRSNGAVDNASGVAAVLAAAARVGPDVAFGVLLPSAEELGLAGARAWARAHAAGVALNCDGVDDDGALVIMYNQPVPRDVIAAVRDAVPAGVFSRTRRMPLGLLTDSTALAASGWRAVTVSHGSLRTLRRIHQPADSLAALRGTRIDSVADILARAAEALAT
ncbi:MAG: M28 family peptidase [bacterium]